MVEPIHDWPTPKGFPHPERCKCGELWSHKIIVPAAWYRRIFDWLFTGRFDMCACGNGHSHGSGGPECYCCRLSLGPPSRQKGGRRVAQVDVGRVLALVREGKSYAEVGRLTGIHGETVKTINLGTWAGYRS